MRIALPTLLLLLPIQGFGQGQFLFGNPNAPTRLGSTNGPFAGPDYWAQMLVGLSPDSLTPVGLPDQHNQNGRVAQGEVTVPGIDGGMVAFVQMWAWNGTLWGTTIGDVPLDQFGRTDIVPITLRYDFQPIGPPVFNQAAIIPIPEPSTWALVVVAAGVFWCATRRRRKSSP